MIELKRNWNPPVQNTAEAPKMPVDAPKAVQAEEPQYYIKKVQPPRKKAKKEPFMSVAGYDYNMVYRTVYEFHKRHTPPELGDDNGSTFADTLLADAEQELQRFKRSPALPFLSDMLGVVVSEIAAELQQLTLEIQNADEIEAAERE